MKELFISLIGIVLLVSCTNSVKFPEKITIQPRDNLKGLLDSFVLINGTNKSVYELYIDKISPDSYNLILHAGSRSLSQKEDSLRDNYPILKTSASNIEFNVYSGIEHFFKNSAKGLNKEPNTSVKKYDDVIWAIRDSAGIVSIHEIYGGYPFMPLPNIMSDSLKFDLSK